MASNPQDIIKWEDGRGDFGTFWADATTITYDKTKAGGSAQVGLAVRKVPATNMTIELVGDGEAVLGKLLLVDADGGCTVQMSGRVELPAGATATLGEGEAIVGALGAASAEGYIRAVNTAVAAELGHARGTIVEDSTTTAVRILL